MPDTELDQHKPQAPLVSVELEPGPKQQAATNRWQWVAVVGIGTFLLPGLVWFQVSEMRANREFQQTELKTSIDKVANTNELVADTNAKMTIAVDQLLENNTRLGERTIEELDDFSDAAKIQNAQIERILNVMVRPYEAGTPTAQATPFQPPRSEP